MEPTHNNVPEILDHEKAKGMLRLKKFVASKLGETSAGQKIIRNVAGVHGTNMLTAIFNMMAKYSGVNEARSMRVHIYKLTGKLSVFIQNHTLSTEMLLECRESCVVLITYVLEQLQLALRLRDTSLFAELVSDAFGKVSNMLRSSVKTLGSATRLSLLYEYVLAGFGEYLLCSADAQVEQELLCSSIRHLMSPFESEVQQIKTHMRDQLYTKQSALMNLVMSPSLHSYLSSVYTSHLLSDFFLDKGGAEYAHIISFHSAVCEYRAITSRSLVCSRARLIRDIYLLSTGDRYVRIPQLLLDEIESCIDSESFSRTLFNKALNFVLGPLDSMFVNEFLSSSLFAVLKDDLSRINQKISVWFLEDPTVLLEFNDDASQEATFVQRLTFWK